LQQHHANGEESTWQSTNHSTQRLQRPMGACLMVKDDNDLLYEWLAFHFTTLVPAGHALYVVLGSDIDSTQDPAAVLQRWKNVPELRYWILQPEDFIHRHGNYHDLYGGGGGNNNSTTAAIEDDIMSPDKRKDHHHHALVHRQKGFITACSQFLKRKGVGWTLYTDTDEFLALHPISSQDDNLTIDGIGHRSITNASYHLRATLSEKMDRGTSVLNILDEAQASGHIGDCVTVPRLLVGALENRSCPAEYGIDAIQQFAQTQLRDRYAYMSTLRFFQHAAEGDFARSKYGKVMMDLSRISYETIQSQRPPRNIHRPYSQHCGPAGGAHFPDSLFFLMHYIGSWERYTSRSDERRNRREWEERAFVHASQSACASRIPLWFPRFVQRVGQEGANYLLGVDR